MTKSDLIEVVAQKLKLPQSRVELIVDGILASMGQALGRDERIEIRGFGSFEVRRYDGYAGRNPRTGAAVRVRPKRLPFFRASKILKQRLGIGTAADAARAKRSAAK